MKMFSSCAENSLLIEELNNMIDSRSSILVLVVQGKAYLLIDHYKYEYPVNDAKRMSLGSISKTQDGVYYFYERMHQQPQPKIARKAVIIKGKKLKSSRR